MRIDNTSGYKGLKYSARKNKWYVCLQRNKKVYSKGYFHTKEEAVKVLQQMLFKLDGVIEQPSAAAIRRQVTFNKDYLLDEKDRPHDIPEPTTHHTITCKRCLKTQVVSVRYTRLCEKCRWDQNENERTGGWKAFEGNDGHYIDITE